ncbi:AraC family transcriptional regulator [Paenibacillus sp. Marseille-Q7038]
MEDHLLLQSIRLNYLYGEQYSFQQDWNYYESTIPYAMVRLIQKGKAVFVINDNEYMLEEGDIIYIPQGCSLSCSSLSANLTFTSLRFTATFSTTNIEIWPNLFSYEVKMKCEDEQIKLFFSNIIMKSNSNERGKDLMLRGYLEIIMAYLINEMKDEEIKQLKPVQLQKNYIKDNRAQVIVDYMIEHYADDFSIEKLSNMVNVSSTTLRRLFRQHTGKSPSEFMMDIKMTVAARKLLETDERISDIGYLIGIQDPNYFTSI